MKTNYPPEGPSCEKCKKQVSIVFLIDRNGPVCSFISKDNDIVMALVGSVNKELPDGNKYTDGVFFWLCEKCLRRKYG